MLYSKAVNFPNEAASGSQTNNGQTSPAIFKRIVETDKTAARECLEAHGNLVWALAKKLTRSTEEAETATLEIFLDIWKCAYRFDSTKHDETDFVILIARRWLIKRMAKSALLISAENSTSN